MSKGEEVLARIKQHRGYIFPYQDLLAREDPDYLELQYSLYEKISEKRHLPQSYKELLFVMIAVEKLHEAGMRVHIKKALDYGITREELIETMEIVDILCGGYCKVSGFRILMEVLDGHAVSDDAIWDRKSSKGS